MYSINNLYLKETNTGYLYIHERPCAWPRHNNIRKKNYKHVHIHVRYRWCPMKWSWSTTQLLLQQCWICFVMYIIELKTYNNLLAKPPLFFWSGYMGNAHCLPALNYWLTCTCSIEQRGDIIICLIFACSKKWHGPEQWLIFKIDERIRDDNILHVVYTCSDYRLCEWTTSKYDRGQLQTKTFFPNEKRRLFSPGSTCNSIFISVDNRQILCSLCTLPDWNICVMWKKLKRPG